MKIFRAALLRFVLVLVLVVVGLCSIVRPTSAAYRRRHLAGLARVVLELAARVARRAAAWLRL